MRQLVILSAAVVYCLAIFTVMYMNTAVFGFGDQSSGEEGWRYDWYIWLLYYFPLLLYGLTLNYIKNEKIKDLVKCNSVFILFLTVVIEISFFCNLSWYVLAIEYIVVGVVWIYVLKLKKYLTSRFGGSNDPHM